MEKMLFKSLRIVSVVLTILFILLCYGAYDPVAWVASLGMSIATLIMLLFVPEEV